MPVWTEERKRRLIRNSDGTFNTWIGGQPDNRDSSFKGNYIHMTAEFKRQEGRAPRVGDTHIHRNKDGTPHKQAMYYIRTDEGWRRSTTEHRKPTRAEIERQNRKSRRGGHR